jgi:transposase
MEAEGHQDILRLTNLRERTQALQHAHQFQAFQWEERLSAKERLLDRREAALVADEIALKEKQERHYQEVQRALHQLGLHLPKDRARPVPTDPVRPSSS